MVDVVFQNLRAGGVAVNVFDGHHEPSRTGDIGGADLTIAYGDVLHVTKRNAEGFAAGYAANVADRDVARGDVDVGIDGIAVKDRAIGVNGDPAARIIVPTGSRGNILRDSF